MQPIPESTEAAAELEPDDDLLERLQASANQVRVLVPTVVGLSLCTLRLGVTFTLVATSAEIAAFDAIQYAAAGPCVDAPAGQPLATTDDELMDEDRWRLFAEVTAAAGVRSTLTLPVVGLRAGITGTVNLYGGTRHAFDGLHEPIAALFGAWAPDAVSNADLSFATRATAALAPRLLRDRNKVETAIGIVAARERIDLDEARRRLQDAAARAGVSERAVAGVVIASGEL